MIRLYKVLVGIGLVFVSVYDYALPAFEGKQIKVDPRTVTVDLFLLTLGMLLLISRCSPKVLKPFGFLQTSIGMAFTLLFAGFLVIKNWNFTQVDTYLGCGLLGGSGVFLLDIFVLGCCLRSSQEDGSGSEQERLLESGAPISRDNGI
jgi:hypothetical protein